jgi:predicted dinucleotide-binding enzyme
MPTAIIGTGNIGTAVATHLTGAGEPVVLAASSLTQAKQLAGALGTPASAATVASAIDQADAVIFAVWFDVLQDLIRQNAARLAAKVVVDPSNPVAISSDGQFSRTLPDGVSAGSVIAGLLPASAHYVKAFGTIGAEKLADAANRTPDLAVLFYATDDDTAAAAAEQLITAAGFDPIKAGGLNQAIRIEMFGDLHDFGGLNGRLLTRPQARALLTSTSA